MGSLATTAANRTISTVLLGRCSVTGVAKPLSDGLLTLATRRPLMPETVEQPTHFMAICDECRTVKSFTSAKARELWERNHPHVDPY